MKIQTQAQTRKELVKAISEYLGIKSKYNGAPTMSYTVGDYTILKDGTIEVEEADVALVEALVEAGYVSAEEEAKAKATTELAHVLSNENQQGNEEPQGEPNEAQKEHNKVLGVSIALPTCDYSLEALTNIVKLVASKQTLINKSIGREGAFHIGEEFFTELEAMQPTNIAEFIQTIDNAEGAVRGLRIDDNMIEFAGFEIAETESDKIKAYTELVLLMGKAAKEQTRVNRVEKPTINEKYTFRVWLMHIGMMGARYKEARNILLKNLDGNAAFRTSEQAEIAKEKNKAKRLEEKQSKEGENHVDVA